MKSLPFITLNNISYSKTEARKYAGQLAESGGFEKELAEFLSFILDEERSELMVNTSGSTGPAKQIIIHKHQFYASASSTLNFLGIKRNGSALLALPVKYIGGKMMVCRAVVGQLNLNIQKPANDLLCKVELSHSIDFSALTPTQVYPALGNETALANLQQIKCLIIGGAPVSTELNEFLRALPNRIYETYGMTETISHIALRQIAPVNENHFTCLPGIKISTDDSGRMIIHAPELGIDHLQTTDIVELKSANTFTWKGRFDNVINSGGIKIHPELEERKIKKVLQRQVVISSQKSDEFGEQLVLVLEGSDLSNREKADLIQQVKNIEGMPISPKLIRVFPFYPRTENGKINRSLIRELLNANEGQGK